MDNKNLIILIAYSLTSMLNIECYTLQYGSESSLNNNQRARVNNNNYGSASQQYQTASSSSSNGISQKSSGSYESIYQPIENTCEIGVSQAIYSGHGLLETYCRCPSGTYGFTCKENYQNPCEHNYEDMYYPADSSLSKSYFLHCEWNVASLLKCPENLQWNQDILSCDHTNRKTSDYAQVRYDGNSGNTYQQPMVPVQRGTYGGNSRKTNQQPMVPVQRGTYGGNSRNTYEQNQVPVQRPAYSDISVDAYEQSKVPAQRPVHNDISVESYDQPRLAVNTEHGGMSDNTYGQNKVPVQRPAYSDISSDAHAVNNY